MRPRPEISQNGGDWNRWSGLLRFRSSSVPVISRSNRLDLQTLLKIYTFIWPDFEHVDGIGSKASLYFNLDVIASSVTHSARLPWQKMKPGEQIKTTAVLKRSHSDSG